MKDSTRRKITAMEIFEFTDPGGNTLELLPNSDGTITVRLGDGSPGMTNTARMTYAQLLNLRDAINRI